MALKEPCLICDPTFTEDDELYEFIWEVRNLPASVAWKNSGKPCWNCKGSGYIEIMESEECLNTES